MKKSYPLFLILCLISSWVFSQNNVSQINYQNIPGWGSTPVGCLFNQPPPPVQIGGLNHYAVSGGVFYTGSSLQLNATNTGLGTAFGIYYPFKINHQYKVEIVMQAPTNDGTSQLLVATNSVLTHASTGCFPEFPNYITSGASATTTINLVGQTEANYTAFTSFSPTVAGINYLLLSSKQYGAIGGNNHVKIKSIKITETPPPCNLAAPIGLTENSGLLQWNSVAGAVSYNIKIVSIVSGVSTTNTFTSNTNSFMYCGTAGSSVSYQVQGVCANSGIGLLSTAFSFSYNTPTPTNLTGTLTWPSSYYYGYNLFFTPVPGITSYYMEWFDVTNNSILNTGNIYNSGDLYYYFSAGRTYKYRLAAQLSCGSYGSFSAWSNDLLPPPASCTTGPISSTLMQSPGCGGNSGCTNTNISWPAISGASQYRVQYNIVNLSSGTYLPTVTITVPSLSTVLNYSTLNGTGWTISYRVSAYCSGSFGNYSGWSSNFFLQ